MSTKQINQIKSLLKTLDSDRLKLVAQLKEARSNQTFKCLCGKYHKIKDTNVVITEGWSQGSGYEDGYSYDKAFFAVCTADKEIHNRFLYSSYFKIDYNKREDFSAQKQFEYTYKELFKNVTKIDEDKFNCKWGNNTYIDDNHKKFGIDITEGLK